MDYEFYEGAEGDSVLQRLEAWEQIADHPFFDSCYGSDKSLIEAMLDKLDEAILR